ncbi:unnamed protein product [Miscanthus lutarioriparius]|uniref:Uncharacterized protein n=1 Tax=Miscanthus lutarioriparius TaxID=422564 RepID=A0A811Q5C5_9POAL|nr:unnamed protein product [Miscanthus lutarioriparius]
MASTLAEELVEEILLRVPPDSCGQDGPPSSARPGTTSSPMGRYRSHEGPLLCCADESSTRRRSAQLRPNQRRSVEKERRKKPSGTRFLPLVRRTLVAGRRRGAVGGRGSGGARGSGERARTAAASPPPGRPCCPGSVGPGKRPRWGFSHPPGRSSDERWDVGKSSSGSRSSSDERWDVGKSPRSSGSRSSRERSPRSSSDERWDVGKSPWSSGSSRESPRSSGCPRSSGSSGSSRERSRSSSDERWDVGKSPRSGSSREREAATRQKESEFFAGPEYYAAPAFMASPDPSQYCVSTMVSGKAKESFCNEMQQWSDHLSGMPEAQNAAYLKEHKGAPSAPMQPALKQQLLQQHPQPEQKQQ